MCKQIKENFEGEKHLCEREKKMNKAMQDIKNILNQYCEKGDLDQEMHDKLIREMEKIFEEQRKGNAKWE